MKKEYDEIMEHIEVTSEMRQRILQHIQEEDISPAPIRTLQFPSFRKYLSVAACFVALLAGTIALPHLLNQGEPEPPSVIVGQGVEEAASLQELSDLVGFEIREKIALPFDVDKINYFSYWNELAEIQYSGAERSARFRKSIGTEDNSGDYTEYKDMIAIDVSGHSVTLRGYDGAYSLAVWTNENYAYSLFLSEAVTEEEWYEILCP